MAARHPSLSSSRRDAPHADSSARCARHTYRNQAQGNRHSEEESIKRRVQEYIAFWLSASPIVSQLTRDVVAAEPGSRTRTAKLHDFVQRLLGGEVQLRQAWVSASEQLKDSWRKGVLTTPRVRQAEIPVLCVGCDVCRQLSVRRASSLYSSLGSHSPSGSTLTYSTVPAMVQDARVGKADYALDCRWMSILLLS